jgi:hypothetical protein
VQAAANPRQAHCLRSVALPDLDQCQIEGSSPEVDPVDGVPANEFESSCRQPSAQNAGPGGPPLENDQDSLPCPAHRIARQ